MVLAAPLDYKPSIVYALTFYEAMAKHQPVWMSRDLVFIFYPESDYASAVREFLDAYYGVDGDGQPVGSLYGDDGRITNRPGYLRQAYPLVIKDYAFSRVSLLVDGVNGLTNDMDFYDATRTVFEKNSFFKYDLGSTNYFRKNPYLSKVFKAMSEISSMYIDAL